MSLSRVKIGFDGYGKMHLLKFQKENGMKFRNSIILLISMCLMCMFGLFMTNELRKRDTKWELIVDGRSVASEQMEFSGFMVVPGGSDNYTLRVTPVSSVYADLILDFDEMDGSVNTPLKDYTRVAVSVSGEQVFDKLLSEVFEGEDYKQVIKVVEGKSFDIDIKFYLPPEVGNVVKNTTADFYLTVTFENQTIGDMHG